MKFTTSLILVFISMQILSQVPKNAELVFVNGKNIYYEVYGKGKPLILLHGYTLSSKSWRSYVQDFENEYEVYLVDLTGHGKSDAFSEELSVRSVARDLNALMQHLQLDSLKAIGFSFGGDVLFQLALLNPPLVESMITIGAVGTWNVEDFPDYREAFTFENRSNFPWLVEAHETDVKINALMEQFSNYKVNVTNLELQSIQTDVLVMVGDEDEGIDLLEAVRVKKNLFNCSLWILPNVSHGAHEGETKEEFIIKSKAFFSKD